MALIPDPEPRFASPDVAETIDVLLPQYEGAVRLRALVAGLLETLEDLIIAPLRRADRGLNPDESEGVLLDWIGLRLGLSRPFVVSADAEFFGFDGTEASGGKPFSQAPFFTRRRGIELVEPIGDATFRLLLKARARRLRGGANRETLEAVLLILFGGGYVDESGADPVLRTTTTEDVLFGLASGDLFDAVFPRPAGTALTLER